MKRFISKFFPIFPIALVLGSMMFSHSCANTTTPPSGGPKDTIPPVITEIYPELGMINVPVHGTKLEIKFNEYVQVKDPKSLFLSPPLEKMPKYKLKGKGVVISFESDLDSNKTYTLDLTNAIGDNNEGNMFPGFTLVFSTGDKIDSMMVTGIVQDCNTLDPIYLFAIGIIFFLISSSGACNEIANVIVNFSFASSIIFGTSPQVETVKFL